MPQERPPAGATSIHDEIDDQELVEALPTARVHPPRLHETLTAPHSVPTKFDAYRDTYTPAVQRSISFIRQDLDFFAQAKADHLLEVAAEIVGEPTKLDVLDVGCGTGVTHRFLHSSFARLWGVDISPELIAGARERNPDVRYRPYDGDALPYPDERFDVVFTINVLHHVPPRSWPYFVSEMRRVTKPGGAVVAFEHNPWNPLTRLAVSRCAFDDDCELLSRGKVIRLLSNGGLVPAVQRYILFFPWRGLRRLERYLAALPFGAQHMVAAIRPF